MGCLSEGAINIPEGNKERRKEIPVNMAANHSDGIKQARRVGFILCALLILVAMNACGSPAPQQPGGGEQATPAGTQPTVVHEEQCGDGLCEQGEKASGKCCMDCGCSEDTKICDRYFNKCIDKITLDDARKNEIIAQYKQWPFLEMVDDVYDNQAVKALKFNCGDSSNKCTHVVYVDKDGKIIKEEDVKS